uniref:Uncharacterized protein n=1 Tax=uncultured Rhodospirillales bacterium HF0200_01O14 TaxID=710787 RepID=E0XTS8_9PROT|nr:hypothetical protein [uncultured Rhodospirillales bacterium HF0200_01O14]
MCGLTDLCLLAPQRPFVFMRAFSQMGRDQKNRETDVSSGSVAEPFGFYKLCKLFASCPPPFWRPGRMHKSLVLIDLFEHVTQGAKQLINM